MHANVLKLLLDNDRAKEETSREDTKWPQGANKISGLQNDGLI